MKNYASLTDVPVYLRENKTGLVLHIVLTARPEENETTKIDNLNELSRYVNSIFSNARAYEWFDYVKPTSSDLVKINDGIVGPIYFNTMKYDRDGCQISVHYDRNGNPVNHSKPRYAHYISAKISPIKAAKMNKNEYYVADVSINVKPALINNTRMFFVSVRDINIK